MKHIVPTLSALALVSITASALSAASISPKEEGLSISIKGQLQTRLTLMPSGTTNDVTAGGTPWYYGGGDPVYYGAFPAANVSTPPALAYYTGNNPNSGMAAATRYTKDGESYDPIRGVSGNPEEARFDVRRGRLAVEAKYKDGWKGNITLSFDKIDSNYAAQGRTPAIYYAYVAKAFKTGTFEHEIGAGLDKPYTAESSISSSAALLPTNRPAGDFVDYQRGVGLTYKMFSEIFNVGASFMNSTTAAHNGGGTNGFLAEGTNGYYANMRVEFAPPGMMPKKKQESYIGAEGTHLLVGFEYDTEWDKQVAYAAPAYPAGAPGVPGVPAANAVAAPFGNPWSEQDLAIWGPDVLFHAGAITAMAEYKQRTVGWESMSDTDSAILNPEDVSSSVWNIQAGFAIPMADGMVIEPAVRYAMMDMDTEREEYSNYGRGVDYTGLANNFSPAPTYSDTRNSATLSGNQIELGVNLYLNGNSNKLQLSYLNWQAEQGIGDAQMLILQHQLTF